LNLKTNDSESLTKTEKRTEEIVGDLSGFSCPALAFTETCIFSSLQSNNLSSNRGIWVAISIYVTSEQAQLCIFALIHILLK
jgi:hypothetical protein